MQKFITTIGLSLFLLTFTACSQIATEPDVGSEINTEITTKVVTEVTTEVPTEETLIDIPSKTITEEVVVNKAPKTAKIEDPIIINTNQKMVTLKTNHGDIKLKLYEDKTPKTVKNFYELSKEGKYDGAIFHRVIDGFMIQGGDYENFNGTGGTSIYGKNFEDEFVEGLSNVRGAISMANAGPGTNGSQFFIVHQDAVFLDGRHTVFGHVIEGMDVVDKIAKVKTGMGDAPLEKVEIIKAVAK